MTEFEKAVHERQMATRGQQVLEKVSATTSLALANIRDLLNDVPQVTQDRIERHINTIEKAFADEGSNIRRF